MLRPSQKETNTTDVPRLDRGHSQALPSRIRHGPSPGCCALCPRARRLSADRPEASRARQKFPLHRLVLAPPARLSKVELRQLSRKQRKRRREGMYWDNVLAHTVRQNVREEKARLLKQERDDWRVLTENYDKPRARDSASPRMDCKRRLAFMFRCCRSCPSHPPRENKGTALTRMIRPSTLAW